MFISLLVFMLFRVQRNEPAVFYTAKKVQPFTWFAWGEFSCAAHKVRTLREVVPFCGVLRRIVFP